MSDQGESSSGHGQHNGDVTGGIDWNMFLNPPSPGSDLMSQGAPAPRQASSAAPEPARSITDAIAANYTTFKHQEAPVRLGYPLDAGSPAVASPPPEVPQRPLSPPELFESGGPQHDLAVVQSRRVMEAMHNNPRQRRSLDSAMAISHARLAQPLAVVAATQQIAPSPPAWSDLTPDWRPAVWHPRTYPVSAGSAVPRNAGERLELFRALYPTLHYFLKQTPNLGSDISLGWTYDKILDSLRIELVRLFPGNANRHIIDGLPRIDEGWVNYIEDWDVSGQTEEVKQQILKNWDNPRREEWKAQRCPFFFHQSWVSNDASRAFLNDQQQLKQAGLPKSIGLEVGVDNRLYIVEMKE